MARPRRPASERECVRAAAADVPGTAARRAAIVAERVAAATLCFIDGAPGDRVSALLRRMAHCPIETLATDADIDTAGLVSIERIRRLEARGGRRLLERDWPAEDRAIGAAVTKLLARRYRGYLAPVSESCR